MTRSPVARPSRISILLPSMMPGLTLRLSTVLSALNTQTLALLPSSTTAARGTDCDRLSRSLMIRTVAYISGFSRFCVLSMSARTVIRRVVGSTDDPMKLIRPSKTLSG